MYYVPMVARRYLGCGLPFEEMIAAGNLGLVEAAIRFDVTRGVKFVTYADWWIRKTILSTIQQQNGPVRLPRYRTERIRLLKDVRDRIRRRHGVNPDIKVLVEASGFSEDEVREALTLALPPLSLQQPLKSDGTIQVGDTLRNPARTGDTEHLIRKQYASWVLTMLGELESRERRVLLLRYGLAGSPAMTLREIGTQVGLTRERVRQIEHIALNKLRGMV